MLKLVRQVQQRNAAITPICLTKRYNHSDNKRKVATKTNSEVALIHYDIHIGNKMENWPSARLALLSPSKYCAVLNRFSDGFDATIRKFAEGGGFNFMNHPKDPEECTGKYSILKEKTHKLEDTLDQTAEAALKSSQNDLQFFVPSTRVLSNLEQMIKDEEEMYEADITHNPELVMESQALTSGRKFVNPHMLNAIIYSKGDVTRFKPATRCRSTGKLSYYLMDAASILPILALDLELGCSVLDLCAAPGGKTHAMLQTMVPGKVVCVDKSMSRVNRLKEVIMDFLPYSYLEEEKVVVEHRDSVDYGHHNPNQFDRVLVDVPCFADRHSLNSLDNNLFKPSRLGDRMSIQQTQHLLLMSAIQACKPGGIIVYSTCTLLPPQNDGIIRSTLEAVHTQTNMKVSVVDTGYLAESYENHFVFNENPLYGSLGQLVLPNVVANFGPIYFCKLRRIE